MDIQFTYVEKLKNMSKYIVGNLFLFLSILTASAGQVIIKTVIAGLPEDVSILDAIRLTIFTERIWLASLAVILIVFGFIFWIVCLHKLPLSYAYPIACSSALFVAFMCVFFLGEPVSWRLWAGTLIIALGASLVITSQ